MPDIRTRHCWRSDLSEFRGLTEAERSLFLLVLEWFENFRLRCGLEAGRDSTEVFWRKEVVPQGRPRKPRQLEQWEDAIKWYLNWLDACAIENADHRNLPEWARTAVRSAGARRGLALGTVGCYSGWAARYATFAGRDREMKRLETANRFLASVVDDEDCSYSTQKQALNALTLFFKQIWGMKDPVFDVKLKRAN
ncbi:MAG: phage integrase N-terminal SAM-like domain-containing protein [Luteolibacter sp.]